MCTYSSNILKSIIISITLYLLRPNKIKNVLKELYVFLTDFHLFKYLQNIYIYINWITYFNHCMQ